LTLTAPKILAGAPPNGEKIRRVQRVSGVAQSPLPGLAKVAAQTLMVALLVNRKRWVNLLTRIIHEILKSPKIKTEFHSLRYTLLFQHNHIVQLYQYDKLLFIKLMNKVG